MSITLLPVEPTEPDREEQIAQMKQSTDHLLMILDSIEASNEFIRDLVFSHRSAIVGSIQAIEHGISTSPRKLT